MAASENIKGAIYMSLAMAGFGVNDMLVKSVTEDLTTGQIMFIRGAISTVLILIIAGRMGALRSIRSIWSPMLALRVVADVIASVTYIYALSKIPLANASAILQFLPLAVTLGAALFLKEQVGWRRWGAIIFGFLGVMLIVRPGPDGFSFASIIAILCVFAAAGRDLATKQIAKGIPSVFVTAVTSVATMTCGAALIDPLGGWNPVSLFDFSKLAIAACFLLVGYQTLIMSMRTGEISFIAPFRYISLLWAILLGYVVFSDLPDAFMLAGAAIVVLSGIYTFYRENYRRTARLAQASVPRAPH
jgi:drug/metabolite transporter (DMT)-like permease